MLMLSILPELSEAKGIDSIGTYPNSIIYILSLFVLLVYVFFTRKYSEIKLLKYYRVCFNHSSYIRLSILLILALWIGRLAYYLYIYSSPYTFLVQEGHQTSSGLTNQLINYYFVSTNFKLYPVIQGIIILTLPRKYWPLFFFFEAIYAFAIFSKFLLFTNILLSAFLYLPKKINLVKALLIGLTVVVLFFLTREFFGQLRLGNSISLVSINLRDILVSGISRVQAFFPIFYTEHVINEWMYGKSLCKVIGLIVPDSLLSIPIHCQNIDENYLLYYLGITDLRIINKDMLNLWSEPFANFSFFGVFLIGFCILLFERFIVILGSGRYSAVFTWVVMINTLMAQISWSAFIGMTCISFIILWLLKNFLDIEENSSLAK